MGHGHRVTEKYAGNWMELHGKTVLKERNVLDVSMSLAIKHKSTVMPVAQCF